MPMSHDKPAVQISDLKNTRFLAQSETVYLLFHNRFRKQPQQVHWSKQENIYSVIVRTMGDIHTATHFALKNNERKMDTERRWCGITPVLRCKWVEQMFRQEVNDVNHGVISLRCRVAHFLWYIWTGAALHFYLSEPEKTTASSAVNH